MAPSSGARRISLGKRRGFASQQRTYRTPDYLEIDDVEGYDVTRRRIFYDEVLLVTLHSSVAWGVAVMAGVLGVLLSVLCLALASESRLAAALVFICGGLPLLTLAVLRLARRSETVTVFGKRTRAQMSFWPKAKRGREVYLLVCRLAQERQTQIAARQAPPDTVLPATAPAVPSA